MAGKKDGGSLDRTDVLSRTPMLAGKYQLGRLIGEGGMGTVYEATHVGLGAQVAVKLLGEGSTTDPKSIARFKREAKAMGQIRHPNVVQVMDTGADEYGLPYLVMELLNGESLSAVLRREKMLDGQAASEVAVQVLAGLSAAHSKGVIHRDLKPGNVFVAHEDDGTRRVKILDFGISKLHDSTTHNVTAEGALVGTPNFMAPEQITGAADLDHRIDIYAVGVLLYRMVAGRLPYVASAPDELYKKILAAKPTKPREINDKVSLELQEVILRAMAPKRADRFSSSAAFQRALHDIFPTLDTLSLGSGAASVSTLPRHAANPTVPESPGSKRRAVDSAPRTIRPLIMGVSALAVLVAAFFGWKAINQPTPVPAVPAADAARAVASPVYEGPPAVFGITQYLPSEMIRAETKPILAYLGGILKREVKLKIYRDYAELADRVASGEVTLGALSPYSYVRATQKDVKITLLAKVVDKSGTPYYRGNILVRAQSDIKTLADLKGKAFCYVNTRSTSGYLLPRAILRRQLKVDPDKFLGRAQMNSDHLEALRSLNDKRCDAAAVYASVWLDGQKYSMPAQRFRAIATTEKIPYDAYVVSSDMEPEKIAVIKRALLALEYQSAEANRVFGDGGDRQIQGFTSAIDSDYQSVRDVADLLGDPTGGK